MNIALIAQQRFFETLRALQHLPLLGKRAVNETFYTSRNARSAPIFIAAHAVPKRATGQISQKSANRPLRVLRVVESGQSSASVGRMVISGRMADVCAELDRLAAREAALT